MKWKEIRRRFPDTWVLVVATSVHSKENKRIIEQMSVVDKFSNSVAALDSYKQVHTQYPEKELYIFHTSREHIEVIEQRMVSPRRRI